MPEDEVRWMTYAEVRDTFSLPSTKAAVQRSRRAGWTRRQNNSDKFARVAVPVTVVWGAVQEASLTTKREASRQPPALEGTGSLPAGGKDPHAIAAMLAELRTSHDHLAGELRTRAERAEAEASALAGRVVELTRSVGGAEGRAAAEREGRERAEAERDAARAARDAADAEAAAWMAGSPFRRAVRAFTWRRG